MTWRQKVTCDNCGESVEFGLRDDLPNPWAEVGFGAEGFTNWRAGGVGSGGHFSSTRHWCGSCQCAFQDDIEKWLR